MAGLDEILQLLPVDRIAAKLGVDPAVAAQAVQEGGGAILGALQKNASTAEGASALQAALGQHADLGDAVDPDRIDTIDGEKILGHVFGGRQQQVAATLTDEPQTAGVDFGKLLPMLAPIVLGMLAKKGGAAAAAGPTSTSSPTTDAGGLGGGIGDLIGGLLGGLGGRDAGASGDDAGRSGGLGGLLGGLLGGNR